MIFNIVITTPHFFYYCDYNCFQYKHNIIYNITIYNGTLKHLDKSLHVIAIQLTKVQHLIKIVVLPAAA